ncbi:hypothetical protein Tco_0017908 [Tanacetum coccineum]
MTMWIISRGVVLLKILMMGIEYLEILKPQNSLHRSSINNSASLSNKFRGFYFIFKFGISGVLHHVVTAIANRIQELLEYMDVHDNDASESSQPSWGKIVYVGEVVYSTSLSMVRVKYSANVRRIVADFLHVPPNRYSLRPNDKQQWNNSVVSLVPVAADPRPADPTEPSSQESSSNVQSANPPFDHISKWMKIHPLENMIVNPSRLVSTRKQLQTDAMWCFFDAFLTSDKPKNFKEALLESSWIDVMQE